MRLRADHLGPDGLVEPGVDPHVLGAHLLLGKLLDLLICAREHKMLVMINDGRTFTALGALYLKPIPCSLLCMLMVYSLVTTCMCLDLFPLCRYEFIWFSPLPWWRPSSPYEAFRFCNDHSNRTLTDIKCSYIGWTRNAGDQGSDAQVTLCEHQE